MKYYIKATNTETGKTEIMTVPVFTSRKAAERFAAEFIKSMTPIARLEIVTDKK